MLLALVFAVVGIGVLQLPGRQITALTVVAMLLFAAAVFVALTDQVG